MRQSELCRVAKAVAGGNRLTLKELPPEEHPAYRLSHYGPGAISSSELLTLAIGAPDFDKANELLARSGGLVAMSRLSEAELHTRYGLTATQSRALRVAFELGRRLQLEEHRPTSISSPADAAAYLMTDMQDLEQEELRVMLLNTKNGVIGVETVYKGSVNTALIRVGEVLRPAVRANATYILVAHNHPSGDPMPSPEDLQVTGQIAAAGKMMDIGLLDHIVIGRGRYHSMKERGYAGIDW